MTASFGRWKRDTIRRPAEQEPSYLEAIFVLQKKKGIVRSVDVSQHLGVKKTSVCHAVLKMKIISFA